MDTVYIVVITTGSCGQIPNSSGENPDGARQGSPGDWYTEGEDGEEPGGEQTGE